MARTRKATTLEQAILNRTAKWEKRNDHYLVHPAVVTHSSVPGTVRDRIIELINNRYWNGYENSLVRLVNTLTGLNIQDDELRHRGSSDGDSNSEAILANEREVLLAVHDSGITTLDDDEVLIYLGMYQDSNCNNFYMFMSSNGSLEYVDTCDADDSLWIRAATDEEKAEFMKSYLAHLNC